MLLLDVLFVEVALPPDNEVELLLEKLLAVSVSSAESPAITIWMS